MNIALAVIIIVKGTRLKRQIAKQGAEQNSPTEEELPRKKTNAKSMGNACRDGRRVETQLARQYRDRIAFTAECNLTINIGNYRSPGPLWAAMIRSAPQGGRTTTALCVVLHQVIWPYFSRTIFRISALPPASSR